MVAYRRIATGPCEDCGTEITRIRASDRPFTCDECTVKRRVESIRQMANKSGPYYDRWLATRGPAGRPRKSGG